jgi:hypothetical protein
MCFFRKYPSAASLLILALDLSISAGCDPENKNNVDCLLSDCDASCKAKGLAAGECKEDICECTEAAGGSYVWTDTSTDGATDTDTDTDVDSGSTPDSDRGFSP